MKTYAILGAGGSFGIHTALYLLDHASPRRVIGIGRNPLRPEPFSLNIQKRKEAKDPAVVAISKQYGEIYFDGPREYGYGGYR